MSVDRPFATLSEIAAMLATGATTSQEIVERYLDRIARANSRLNAFAAVLADRALEHAGMSDARRSADAALGPLDGVPISVKDNFDIAGLPAAVGSKAWVSRTGAVTAAAVERLEAAGMVVLGKNTMVEFAWGAWGTNYHCGTPWNPWDLATHRTPGGSSSGSGVAVAAGLAPAAIGTDTGGSVRIPAAMNGLVGLKTTFGRVSLFGCYPLSTTLDTVGPLTRTVDDAQGIFRILAAGPDPRDPGTYTAPPAGAERPDIVGMRISLLPEEHFPQPAESSIREAWLKSVRLFRDLGATVEERPFPFDMKEFVMRIGRLIAAESYSIHRGWIEDESLPFDPAVRARTLAGKAVTAADYIEARDHQRRSIAQFVEWMQGFDAVLTPSTATTAIPVADVDESTTPAVFTRTANYLGTCAITVPAGISPAGLPIGIQLIGKPNRDETVLNLGAAFEAVAGTAPRVPDLSALFE